MIVGNAKLSEHSRSDVNRPVMGPMKAQPLGRGEACEEKSDLRSSLVSKHSKNKNNNKESKPKLSTTANSFKQIVARENKGGKDVKEPVRNYGGQKNPPKGGQRVHAVDKSVIDGVQKLQGENDALKEMLVVAEERSVVDIRQSLVIKQEDSSTSADFEGAREYVRLQFHKFADNPQRIKNVLSNVNHLVLKFRLHKEEDHADKLVSMIYEEAEREATSWDAYRQEAHDEYRSTVFDAVAQRKKYWKRVAKFAAATVASTGIVAGVVVASPAVAAASIFTMLSAGWVFKDLGLTHKGLVITQRMEWMDSCCEGVPLGAIELGSHYDDSQIDGVCKPKTYVYGFTVCPANLVIYRGCCHNELVALVNRQLIRKKGSPGVREAAWAVACQRYMQTDFYKKLPDFDDDVTPEEVEKFLARYPVGRRNQLRQSLSKADGTEQYSTRPFVKSNEILALKAFEKSHPRLVTNYENAFLLATIAYWYWQKKCLAFKHDIAVGTRYVFSSGLDPVQTGQWVSNRESEGYYFLELDGSRFDGRTTRAAKQANLRLYEGKKLPDQPKRLFQKTVNVFGTTTHGVKFAAEGTVGSGRIDTSDGDSHETAQIIEYGMGDDEVEFSAMINGDDNVLATAYPINHRQLAYKCEDLGHDMEVIPRPDVDLLEYCSARFWRYRPGSRVLGPKIGRVLAKAFMPHRTLSSKQLRAHIIGVARGYYHYRWLPGLDVVLRKLGVTSYSSSHVLEFKSSLKQELEVDMTEVEDMFQNVYGFPADRLRQVMEEIPFDKIGEKGGLSAEHPLIEKMLIVDGMMDDKIVNSTSSDFVTDAQRF